ncbi:MAG: class I SAM-dependent methyltransferase [Gammaproteobacteria bacterium]|nr:class I SAM-dependent methyltransferase [Gammaproteobacteria bacterium]
MSRKTINLTDDLYAYLLSISLQESAIQRELREETAKHPMAMMQIAPEQGQFMALLIQLINAKNIIEIGVFTGYSTLCMAMALPDDGRIIACDINEDYTNIAGKYWQKAGVAGKIELRLAPAIEIMDELLDRGQAGHYDFVFIDAEKSEYLDYYERALKLLRPGGLITIDNVLWSGKPANPEELDKDTVAIRDFNKRLFKDTRVNISLLPIADGLTLALKL